MSPVSWKPEVNTAGEWTGNGMRFATKEEAERWGKSLLARWTAPADYRAVESDEPVNFRLDEQGVLHPVAD